MQDAYDNLSETVNSKIVPYYHENKHIFQSLIDINNKTTAVIETFTKAELELMNKRYTYSDPTQNKDLKPFQPFVERYSSHEDSIKDYNKVKKILSDDFYASPKVSEALNQANKVMKKTNPELEKLKPLYRKYVETTIDIDLHNDQETLLLSNKPLLDKFNKLKNDSLKSVAFAYSMQMPEIINLIKSTKGLEKEVVKNVETGIMASRWNCQQCLGDQGTQVWCHPLDFMLLSINPAHIAYTTIFCSSILNSFP